MSRIVLVSMMAFGVAFGLVFSLGPGASAQVGGSLIISVSQCPDGYAGQNFSADCVDPAAGVAFFIGTPNTGNSSSTTTGGDGLATFNLEQFDLDPTAPDAVSVGEPASQTGDYAVACTKNEGETVDFVTESIPFEPGGPLLGIRFEFEAGDNIGCEWYRLSQPMPGEVEPPVVEEADDVGGVEAFQLPNTGTGSIAVNSELAVNNLLPLASLLAIAGGALLATRRTAMS